VLRAVPLGGSRPDVAQAYPEVLGAHACQFVAATGVLGLPTEFELGLQAVLQDGGRVDIATIQARRRPLRSGFQPTIQPLMITSLPRSGGTWLMRLLAEHPAIVVDRAFPYERRLARYWLQTLKVLAEPADHHHSTPPEVAARQNRWIGSNPFYPGTIRSNLPEASRWLGRDYVEQLARFCQQSIEHYYRLTASGQGQEHPALFAEKHPPDHVPGLAWELYPRAREVLLVRDFRDVVCSVLAFNAKRGFASFGRDRAESDAAFVAQLRGASQRLLAGWLERSVRLHLVRYEDLVLRPRHALRSLLTYLGLDASPHIVEGMLDRAVQDAPLEGHRTSADPAMSIGRWRRDLDADLWPVARDAFDDALEAFGYRPTPC
jgi:hypothetical protein